eukprot:2585415-Rhodomonas_salina.6
MIIDTESATGQRSAPGPSGSQPSSPCSPVTLRLPFRIGVPPGPAPTCCRTPRPSLALLVRAGDTFPPKPAMLGGASLLARRRARHCVGTGGCKRTRRKHTAHAQRG